jgi:hypothetical protein
VPAATAAKRLAAEPDLLAVRLELDPLYAPIASVLGNLARPLLVVISEKSNAYMTTEARAEMAASLATVRYVTVGEMEEGLEILDLRRDEEVWRAALERLVLAKQNLGAS